MEEALELRHVAGEKPPVLADAVAAHRGCSLGHERGEKLQSAAFRFGGPDPACPHAAEQPRGAVLLLVPLVHARKAVLRLVNGEHRPFADDVQLLVGHDGGDLDDEVGVRLEPGHLEVDPDQVVGTAHRPGFPAWAASLASGTDLPGPE